MSLDQFMKLRGTSMTGAHWWSSKGIEARFLSILCTTLLVVSPLYTSCTYDWASQSVI